MSPKTHQPSRRTQLREPASLPILIMRQALGEDVIDTEYIDENTNQQSRPAGQRRQDRLRQNPRGEYTPPPHNTVPAKPWNNNKFGWTNSPSSDASDSQTSQAHLSDVPHFIHLEEDALGNGLKGAFFLTRRMIMIILFMFALMIIGAQTVPDILELIFSFI